jgi:hypothetical protein
MQKELKRCRMDCRQEDEPCFRKSQLNCLVKNLESALESAFAISQKLGKRLGKRLRYFVGQRVFSGPRPVSLAEVRVLHSNTVLSV